MKMRHILALAAAALVVVMAPTPAYADTRFHADSGDCYGLTDGVLSASLATVTVAGTLTDRPTPVDPVVCRDDGFFSVATFTGFAGTRIVDQHAVRANNSTVRFEFVLGSSTAVARIDRIVIQVCRNPLVTLPPSYCGRAVTYLL